MTQQEFRQRFAYDVQKDLIAKGGFADVFRARDNQYKEKYLHADQPRRPRWVALKFFKLRDERKYTLEEEVNTAIYLQHPNIGRYLERIELQSPDEHGEIIVTHVAVLEYLDGGHIDQFARLYPAHLDLLLTDMLQGLDYLHKQKVIHRDIKPSNVLGCLMRKDIQNPLTSEVIPWEYADQGTWLANDELGYETLVLKEDVLPHLAEGEYVVPAVKITDFGISKSLETSSGVSSRLFGSRPYMAPEQIDEQTFGADGKIDTRVDIWSFGVTAYELIAGKKLFEGMDAETDEVVRRRIMTENIDGKLEALDARYRQLLQRCLVRKAAERAQSCTELINLLKKGKRSSYDEHIETAKQHRNRKDLDQTKAELQKALVLKPDGEEALRLLEGVQLLLDEADGHYKRAAVAFSESAYAQAAAELRKALNIYPQHKASSALIERVEEALQRTRPTDLENRFRQCAQHAQACFDRRDYENARIAIRVALALRPDNVEMKTLLARIEEMDSWGGETELPSPASKGKRILAGTVDIIAALILAVIVFLLMSLLCDGMTGGNSRLADNDGAMTTIVILSFLGYYTIFEWRKGCTLGKLVAGTRTINTDGSNISFETAFLRSLVRVYLAWFDQFSVFGKTVLHDVLTSTYAANKTPSMTTLAHAPRDRKTIVPNEMRYTVYSAALVNTIFYYAVDTSFGGSVKTLLIELPGAAVALLIYATFKPGKKQANIPTP